MLRVMDLLERPKAELPGNLRPADLGIRIIRMGACSTKYSYHRMFNENLPVGAYYILGVDDEVVLRLRHGFVKDVDEMTPQEKMKVRRRLMDAGFTLAEADVVLKIFPRNRSKI
jgi:hypothetical protein